jgi:guanosine-3',5'-bis(diphosphate) 3'-pyrophosphohydrolase
MSDSPQSKNGAQETAKNVDREPNIDDLIASIQTYFPEADLGVVRKAHDFSVKLHEGQKRKSGEPYIVHPISVSLILASMRMDIPSIVTGLLHDTVEDTSVSLTEIASEFGQEISQLVDGVTKISKISFKSSHEKQAENFRKMILAMSKDIRVILVKLADRTHNMRTLQHLAANKQQNIAQETLEIYAPLANRLGISWMKIELEDLSLRYLKNEIYQKISKLVAKKKSERSEYIETLIKILTEKLAEYGLKVRVSGRSKHFYSIHKKMESRKINFDEINDLVAFRILTRSIGECYEALGIVHQFFKPVPGRFKDYIAMPKNNLYQSLHTTVIGPFGERLEIQIRTDDMHNVAESGIAAHWEYKEGKLSQKDSQKFHWLRQLLEAQESLTDPSEFLESVKLDLFEGDIYVFTPKGELRDFPAGSTPLDFAYAVHTDVGHRCVGAKVNGRMVPLRHKLRSGDTVEITTQPTQKPSKDWLKIVKTSRAKSKIRQFIATEERERCKQIGQDLLDREFRKHGESLPKFEKAKDVTEQVNKLSFAGIEEMFIAVGYGKVSPLKVFQRLFPELSANKSVENLAKEENAAAASTPTGNFSKILSTAQTKFKSTPKKDVVRVDGMDDLLFRFSRCCNPLPGDEIVGFISRGRGISVHKLGCTKVLDFNSERLIEVSWAQEADKLKRNVKIRVVCNDEKGILNEMSRIISAQGINIKSLNIRVNADGKAVGSIDLELNHKDQLANCLKELEGLTGIISVERVNTVSEGTVENRKREKH